MNQYRIYTSQHALEDTREIYEYIAEHNPSAADAFIAALNSAAELLIATPEIGSPRYSDHPDLRGMRFSPLKGYENYLLFYRVLATEQVVEIVRIVHGARDLPALFGKNENPEK
jgi:toxin ParE1/3/4